MGSRKRIGELLVGANVITQEQLDRALAHPRKEGERLGDVLVSLEMVSETQLTQALSQQLAVPWVSLYHVDFSRQLLNTVAHAIAEKYCLVPVLHRKSKRGGEQLFVAMDDPTNDIALTEVSRSCGGITVKPMIAARSEIRAAIRAYYQGETAGEAPPSAPPSSQNPIVPKKPPPPSPKARSIPPGELADAQARAAPSADSPDASPEIEAKEITLKPRQPSVPMIEVTLLDGTTIQLPAKRSRATSTRAAGETELTARDLVTALRAVSQGADATPVFGDAPRWEPVVAALLSVLLRKGLIADWEFLEEFKKI